MTASCPAPARSASRWLLALSLSTLALGSLTACAPLVVGGTAATTALVVADRRTAGEQVEDQAIELKAASQLSTLLGNAGRSAVTSYGGKVLLVGDVPDEATRQKAEELVSTVEKVQHVVNQLRIGAITPLSVRTNDSWLTTKVTTALISTKDVPTRTIVVTTERGVVYLLGRVTSAESERAGKAAASVAGVNKVVKLLEIITLESLADAPVTDAGGSPAAQAQHDAGSPDVQTMPVQ